MGKTIFVWVSVCISVLIVLGILLIPNDKTAEAKLAEKQKIADQKRGEDIGRRVQYFQDSRTDLCFAYVWSGGNVAISSVPCTDEVKKLIKDGLKGPF